ncbi:hypothetical protein GLOIN_2v1791993 [Rhizophagus clarus]|uniref:Uncharacterized protein n=1 Tax=Rhizophagus clarus TaxID=94130 RepID=A0A8H3LC45_9GLOM|nr:hypothetical protein GLOIN_2v1791993 [Rhizophagus clarus]
MSDYKNCEVYQTTDALSIKEREYQIGTCYLCQKCLYYNANLIIENCSCDKTIKPTNGRNKVQLGFVRNGLYNPSKSHCVLIALLHSNSVQENNQILTNEKSEMTIKQPDKLSKVDNMSNLDLSFHFKLVIKTPDLTKPAKAITLENKPVNYYEFEKLILQRVCEAIGLLICTDYELSYKPEKKIRTGTILEEEEDFEEFIKEYYKLTNSNKVLLITASKHLILDNDKESISEENEIMSPSKQIKKTSVPKEINLNEIDIKKEEIHKKLKEKHGCDIHKTGYCYIKDNRHLLLTTLHLSMWIDEICKNHCDYETPPPHPNFGMGNSLKVPSSNQLLSTSNATNCYSHISPPNAYPYYYGWPPYLPSHPLSQHLLSSTLLNSSNILTL